MENKSFDDIIKSKLDSFSVEMDSNAWELFQDSEADAAFDHMVSEKVGGFTIDEVPADFDYLSEGEDGSLGFDALIGAKLADLNVPDGADWDQFEKILDHDLAFDQEVTNKVAGYEAPLTESQWPKLAAHLEKVEKRRRRIIITKFVEAAVFILFVLSIMQLYPVQNIKKNAVYRTHGVVQGINNINSADSDLVSNDGNLTNKVAIVENEAVQNNSVSSSNHAFQNNNSPALFASNDNEQLAGLNKRPEVLAFSSIEKMNVGSVLFKRSEESAINRTSSAGDRISSAGNQRMFNLKQEETSFFFAAIDIPELEIADRSFSGPTVDLSKSVKKDQYWFSLYGSPELSFINTPYDKSYNKSRFINTETEDVEAYSNLSSGYSLGASITKETANWEVEGGIEYTSLNYFPKQIEEYTGKASTGTTKTLLKEIIFDIIEIPVNLKYSLFRKKGWKVYGSNGFSAGMVAFATYDIDEETSKPLASLEIRSQKIIKDEKSFVDRKTFDEGFLKSTNVKNNIFATVNAGFGVSKEISDNIAFYVQPTYHYNLSQGGIGPNNDVHHRLSLQIGTKVRI